MRNQFANMNLYDRGLTHDERHRRPDAPSYSSDGATNAYYEHSSGQRTNTDAYLVAELRKQHPELSVTVVSPGTPAAPVQLLSWALATGKAHYKPLVDAKDPGSAPYTWKIYLPPTRRLDDGETGGVVATQVKFGKFEYVYDGHTFLLYVAEGRDGLSSFPAITNQYVVHAPSDGATAAVDALMHEAGSWAASLHGEIWVFDGGFWQKSAALWQSVQKSRWADVILDEGEKKMLQDDVARFFDARAKYEALGVPWKRGVIYHGPPGNGKTITIKATMHTLYARNPAIPSLYVKTLSSFGGPEYSVKQIFAKAREQAPCLLIFEDLDSIVTDQVRSYFLNEVDGLAANDGVLMIGSTNHLDRLDPGLSKRPSRFDRKFLFPKPDEPQRALYAAYWRRKLAKTDAHLPFPEDLTKEMARITDDFSFAYMQEAFVATLLAIAAKEEAARAKGQVFIDDDDEFKDLVLWEEFQKQVKILREEM